MKMLLFKTPLGHWASVRADLIQSISWNRHDLRSEISCTFSNITFYSSEHPDDLARRFNEL